MAYRKEASYYEAVPPQGYNPDSPNGGGEASEEFQRFGKPQAYRTECGRAAFGSTSHHAN